MTKPTPEPQQKGSIVKDPEVIAIDRICGLLGSLPAYQRRRVLKFVNDKYTEEPMPAGEPDPRD